MEIVNNYLNSRKLNLKNFQEKFENFIKLKKDEWIEKAKQIEEINSVVSDYDNVNMNDFSHIIDVPDMNHDFLIYELWNNNNKKLEEELINQLNNLLNNS